MSTNGEKATTYFCEGYNCAQATFLAFCEETGMDEKTAARLASGLGGGVGRQREVCGAITGMTMAAGLLRGYDTPTGGPEKTDTYALIQQLCADFKERNGSIICRELLGLQEAEGTPQAAPRTAQYYHDRHCADYCRDAADLLAAALQQGKANA